MRKGILGVVLVAVVGCGETATATPVASCFEQPFRAELHVDARDPRRVWATHYASGRDVAVRPRPPGTFTFDDGRPMSLFDGSGSLVSFSGEISQTGCVDGAGQAVYFGPQDLPDPNRPPN